MVQQRDVIPCRHSDSFIRVSGDPFIVPQMPVSDARLFCLRKNLLHDPLHRVAAARIHDHKLPICVALPAHGIDHLPQEFLFRLISRHHNAEQIRTGRRFPALCFQHGPGRLRIMIMLLFLLLDPLSGRIISMTDAVLFQITHGFLQIIDTADPFSHSHALLKQPSPCISQGDGTLLSIVNDIRNFVYYNNSLSVYYRYAFKSSVSFSSLACASSRLVPFTPI